MSIVKHIPGVTALQNGKDATDNALGNTAKLVSMQAAVQACEGQVWGQVQGAYIKDEQIGVFNIVRPVANKYGANIPSLQAIATKDGTTVDGLTSAQLTPYVQVSVGGTLIDSDHADNTQMSFPSDLTDAINNIKTTTKHLSTDISSLALGACTMAPSVLVTPSAAPSAEAAPQPSVAPSISVHTIQPSAQPGIASAYPSSGAN